VYLARYAEEERKGITWQRGVLLQAPGISEISRALPGEICESFACIDPLQRERAFAAIFETTIAPCSFSFGEPMPVNVVDNVAKTEGIFSPSII